jgi:glycosyltransferase involved in cell wall biosynthesis
VRIGIVWECPWTPSSYGKLVLWLIRELQRLGFEVRSYCPSAPPVALYSKYVEFNPSCIHKKLGVCVELEKPIEVSSDAWACEDGDVDAYLIGGTPYGGVESRWIEKCSKTKHPVAGYFVTESAVVQPLLSLWLLHVDAVGFPTRAVARAFMVHDVVREVHSDWIHAPHGLPEYYFSLSRDEILEYSAKLIGEEGEGWKLALESREDGKLIGVIAKDHPRKDYGALFSAFASLKHALRDDKLRLLLGFIKAVGARMWDVDALMNTLGLSSKDVVTLEGKWQENGVTEMGLLMTYSLMNAFAFPTLGEAFGMPPVEAGALGLPVVVTALPSTEELWEGYPLLVDSTPILMNDGSILYATSYRNLAVKLLKALENPEHYGGLAKAIARKYTTEVMGKSVARLIDNAVRNAGRKKPYPVQKTDVSDPGLLGVAVEALKLDDLNICFKKYNKGGGDEATGTQEAQPEA